MSDTVFAKIIRREIPAEIVYEDGETIAFLDIHPVTPGHSLVVPKQWCENIFDASADVFTAVMETVRRITPSVCRGVGANAANVRFSNGITAGQEVPHLHVHIIPRFTDDGLTHWPWKAYEEGEAARVATTIRTQVNL